LQPASTATDLDGLEKSCWRCHGIRQLRVRRQVCSAAVCTVDRYPAQRCLSARAARAVLDSCMLHTDSAQGEKHVAAARRGRSLGEDLSQVAIHWRQGWWPGSKGSFQPRLGSQLSGEHCTRFHTPSQPCCLAEPPKSALSQQKQACCGSLCLHCICSQGNTMATPWQHNGSQKWLSRTHLACNHAPNGRFQQGSATSPSAPHTPLAT